MKRVLITGSLGYIGTVLVPYLNEHGFNCVGYDSGFFEDCYLYPPKPQKTIFKDARRITKDDLKNIDAVVHLAAMSNDPLMSLPPEIFYDPVRKYSIELAQICKETGTRFVFASSCSVYGVGNGLLTEESTTKPQTGYSLNKLQIENDLREISDRNFSPIALRFATAYGLSPRLRLDLVINMFAAMAFVTEKIILNSDGKAWRPFIHILDMCKAIRYSIDYAGISGKLLVLNAGDNRENYRIIDIAEMVKKEVPGCEITHLQNVKHSTRAKDIELVKDRKIQDGVDTRTYTVAFDKITRVFKGFKCDWTVQDGIREMLDCFEKIGLSEKQLNDRDFYRLQKMEYLLKNGNLTEELFWTAKQHKK